MIASKSASAEWKAGWGVVVAGCLGMMMSALVTYTIGLYMAPLATEFGWGRATVSAGTAIMAVVSIMAAPLVGILIDSIGSRRVGLVGIVWFSLGYALLSRSDGSLLIWYGTWLFVAIGHAMLGAAVWTSAVTSRFERARGIAIAFVLCGSPVSAIAGPPVVAYFLENHDWRMAFLGVGLIWGTIAFPVVLLFFFSAKDLERRKSVISTETMGRKQNPDANAQGFAIILRTPAFVKLAAAAFLITFVATGSVVHFIPMIVDSGALREQAPLYMGALGIGGLFGRIFAGTMLDRLDGRVFGSFFFMFLAVPLLLIWFNEPTPLVAFAAAFLLGFSGGTEIEVSSYLASRYFSLGSYGRVFATIAGLISLAAGLGAPVVGLVYDRFGSYDAAILGALPLCLIAGLLLLTLGKPRPLVSAAH